MDVEAFQKEGEPSSSEERTSRKDPELRAAVSTARSSFEKRLAQLGARRPKFRATLEQIVML